MQLIHGIIERRRTMKIYRVFVKEVWVQAFDIEAESKEEAIKLITEGDGDIVQDELDYSHSLDPDTWTVEELDEN